MTNSHRDNVKDAIYDILWKRDEFQEEDVLHELKANIADVVFDALGITEDEQDSEGGYFMLHAVKGEKIFTPPRQEEDKGYDDAIESQTGEEGAHVESMENEWTKRTKELADGAKYTSDDFMAYAIGRKNSEGGDWYITLQTPICKYGQGYCKTLTLADAKQKFANFYYPIYLDDYERSLDVDKMDKE